jgi:hypothetical protein
MTRLGSDGWSSESGASLYDPHSARVADVVEALCHRAESVADEVTARDLRTALRGLGDEWWGYRQRSLIYGWRTPDLSQAPPAEEVLLRVPEGGRVGHWPAPQSLREVEPQSFVRVLGLNAT